MIDYNNAMFKWQIWPLDFLFTLESIGFELTSIITVSGRVGLERGGWDLIRSLLSFKPRTVRQAVHGSYSCTVINDHLSYPATPGTIEWSAGPNDSRNESSLL